MDSFWKQAQQEVSTEPLQLEGKLKKRTERKEELREMQIIDLHLI